DPKLALAHTNLGVTLAGKGQEDEAIACFKKAIALDPKFAGAHNNLGVALHARGDLDEAIACLRKGIQIDPKLASARTVLATAEPVAAVQGKLPPRPKGEYKPKDKARLALAELCSLKRLNRASAGLYADAFAADPKLAADPNAGHRYNAACQAALAAAGQGKD